MAELERRALLGDQEAQEKCTEKGLLLPCPFCGGNAMVEYDTVAPFEYSVCCGDCGVQRGLSEDEKVAKREWNTRPALQIVQELREKLERVTSERDAAIAERDELIRGMKIFGSGCYSCKHFDRSNGKCRAEEPCGVNNNWEWRGIQEAQKDE